jgi:hypothetical protein
MLIWWGNAHGSTNSRKYNADILHKTASLMNNPVKQSHSREADSSAASQEILLISWKSKGYHGVYKSWQLFLSLFVSFQMICQGPRLFVLLHDVLCIHTVELLAFPSTSEMEDHTLSAVPQQLIEYSRTYLAYLETVFSIRNLTTHHR